MAGVDDRPFWGKETAEQFDARCEVTRLAHVRVQAARALAFCNECKTQHAFGKPCPRCEAFRLGRPWRHEDLR